MLTFVVPVRHPANARDWSLVRRNLSDTARSIAAQRDPRWQAVVVANEGADLPDLPAGVSVARVDFAPNPSYALHAFPLEEVYEAVRADKGRRVLAGLIATRPVGHVMVVDDDDFVSRDLAGHAANAPEAPGWWLETGYVWADGGRLVYRLDGFSELCGTSHVVRADLLPRPETLAKADDREVRRLLGSHKFIRTVAAERGTPLRPLPFRGAVYRVGHPGAHSLSSGLRRQFFPRRLLRSPGEIVPRLLRLGLLTDAIRTEFFGIPS